AHRQSHRRLQRRVMGGDEQQTATAECHCRCQAVHRRYGSFRSIPRRLLLLLRQLVKVANDEANENRLHWLDDHILEEEQQKGHHRFSAEVANQRQEKGVPLKQSAEGETAKL